MDLLKKVNAFVLGLAVLLAVGCGGDEENDPAVQGPVAENFKSCKLRKSKEDTVTYSYVYDNQGRVLQKNAASRNVIYQYNALGKVSRSIFFYYKPDTSMVINYEYNSDSLLT